MVGGGQERKSEGNVTRIAGQTETVGAGRVRRMDVMGRGRDGGRNSGGRASRRDVIRY